MGNAHRDVWVWREKEKVKQSIEGTVYMGSSPRFQGLARDLLCSYSEVETGLARKGR